MPAALGSTGRITEARTVRLLAVSFLALFYELVLIRWLPANITSIAYFSNLVLISCFFGLGLGCLVPRERRDLVPWFPLVLLGLAAAVVLFRNLGVTVPGDSGEWIWSQYAGHDVSEPIFRVGITPTITALFLGNALLFAPLGQVTAQAMGRFPPLEAYTINVAGSMLGILAFALLSLSRRPAWLPTGWFLLGALVSVPLFLGGRRTLLALAACSVLTAGLVFWSSRGEIWSPYYVIQTVRQGSGRSFTIYVNRFLHQSAADLDADPAALEKYSFPYSLKVPGSLLVLGAGSGNDVAAAVRHGVREIDCVEIDPEILRLGRESHPQRPYGAPNVRVFIDDARSFLRKGSKRYDMIVLGTLDSHALLSGMSNIRLDNYVYTREGLQDVKRRLADDGVAVLMFAVPTRWLGEKLVALAADTFGDECYALRFEDPTLFNLMILAGPGTAAARDARPGAELARFKVGGARRDVEVPVDDWPYLYLQGRRIPRHYLVIVVVLTILAAGAVLAAVPHGSRGMSPPFVFLGAGFLLLETTGLTRLSLLFGSTWVVNAAVFLAILCVILLATVTVRTVRLPRARYVNLALFLSLLVNYLVPPGVFLSGSFLVKSLAPCLLAALPIYFAGLVFARMFGETADPGRVYGANLIGCVLGGFLEYASMAVGLRALLVLAAFLYLLALGTHAALRSRGGFLP